MVLIKQLLQHFPFARILLGMARTAVNGLRWPLYIEPWLRQFSIAILGAPGTGKSSLLEWLFLEHFLRGEGVALLDPHGDTAVNLIKRLTALGVFRSSGGWQRLVYINAGEAFPFDILASQSDPYTAAALFVEAILRVYPSLEEAAAFYEMMISSAVVLKASGLPITELLRLLRDKPFRDRCLANVDNEAVLEHFAIFDKQGRDQLTEMGSTRRRAFGLTINPLLRDSLGQNHTVIDPRRFMDEGISLIVNLGPIKDDTTRRLIGALIMVLFEQAAKSREGMPLLVRRLRAYTLIVDEWTSFTRQDKTISTIIEQCRKYHLRLYLVGQSLAQAESERLSAALGSCRVKICFGLDRDTAAIMARHIATIDPYLVKDVHHRPYVFDETLDWEHDNLYMPIPEQFEQWTQLLQNLPERWAYAKLPNRAPVLFRTIDLPEATPDPQELQLVFDTFRARYQVSTEASSPFPAPPTELPDASDGGSIDGDDVFTWEVPE